MAATKTGPARPFTEHEITDALMAVVAWAGNASAAIRHLKSEGKRAPSVATLLDWMRGEHSLKYQEMRERFSEQLEQQLAHEYRDVARLATEVQREALDLAMRHLKAGKNDNPARTAADAATVADKMTGKLLALTGRPTSIREDRNLEEILRKLTAMGVLSLTDEPKQIEEATQEAT